MSISVPSDDGVPGEFDSRALRGLGNLIAARVTDLEGSGNVAVARFVNGRETMLFDLGPVIVEVRARPAASVGDWFLANFDTWVNHPDQTQVVGSARAEVKGRGSAHG